MKKRNWFLLIFIICLIALSYILYSLIANWEEEVREWTTYLRLALWTILSYQWFTNWQNAKTKV